MPRSNVPIRPRLTGATYRIVPTGVAVDDTIAFSDRINLIVNSGLGGVLEVADNGLPLVLDATIPGHSSGKQIMGPVRITGETPYATIRCDNGYLINWGGYTNNLIPTTSLTGLSYYARGAFDGVTAKNTVVVVTNSGWLQTAGIAVGDTITLSSLDEIQGADPHVEGGQNHPGEINVVTAVAHDTTTVSGSTVPRTTLNLAYPIADAMTTSPQLCKVVMLKNCGIHDITLATTKGTNVGHLQTTNISARRCAGFVFENVYSEKFGTVVADLCTDFRMSGYRLYDSSDPQGDYGVVVSACHAFNIEDSLWYNVRHATTTSGQSVSSGAAQYPNHIWGTPSHGVIKGCRAYIRGLPGESWAGFDTHSSGHDITHRDCDVYVGLKGVNVHAFASRCRRVAYHRCRVFGNSGDFVTGFVIRGAESEVNDCEVEGAWMGVQYRSGFRGGSYGTHLARRNKFSDLFGAAVRVQDAVGGVVVHENICSNVRRGAADTVGGYRKTCVELVGTGTGHNVTGNVLDFENSGESVNTNTLTVSQVKLYGNYMRGYGANEMGHYSALVSPSVSIAQAYTETNYTD